MNFLDFLLAGDTTGELHAIVDAERADTAAGITWAVYDPDGVQVATADSRWCAEMIRYDEADAANLPVEPFEIRPVAQTAVAA